MFYHPTLLELEADARTTELRRNAEPRLTANLLRLLRQESEPAPRTGEPIGRPPSLPLARSDS